MSRIPKVRDRDGARNLIAAASRKRFVIPSAAPAERGQARNLILTARRRRFVIPSPDFIGARDLLFIDDQQVPQPDKKMSGLGMTLFRFLRGVVDQEGTREGTAALVPSGGEGAVPSYGPFYRASAPEGHANQCSSAPCKELSNKRGPGGHGPCPACPQSSSLGLAPARGPVICDEMTGTSQAAACIRKDSAILGDAPTGGFPCAT